MKKIATPGRTTEILKKYDLRPSRKLGQNFLIDANIVRIILGAAGIKKGEQIIEIGPGIGSLSQGILESLSDGSKLLVIEKDSRLAAVLEEVLAESYPRKLKIINQDVLELNWQELFKKEGLEGSSVKVIANLPYYITTPIIFSLLESGVYFSRLIFMTQKEVAERMVASPGGKEYGALSVAVQYYTRAEIIHQVPPTVFLPRPEVDSAVISLTPYETPPFKVRSRDFFFRVVRAIFQQRRKNIKNGLYKAGGLSLEKETILKGLSEAEIDPRSRGEKLTVKELAVLSNILWKFKQSDGDENGVH